MSRQWRSDDTNTWNYAFGDGHDGDLTIGSNTTFSAANAGCSGTSGASTLTLDAASTFVNGDLVLIHQSRGTSSGVWELNKISSGGGTTTLTLTHTLQNTYTDSGSSQAQVLELKEYGNVTVSSTFSWTTPAWDQNKQGLLAFFANNSLTISGSVVGTAKGYVGGVKPSGNQSGRTGEGDAGASFTVGGIAANGSGGGSATNNQKAKGSGGGNGAAGSNGSIEAGTTIPGGTGSGNAGLTIAQFGGGGGSGADNNTGDGSNSGGTGGGFILIMAKAITISGSVPNNGSNGTASNWPAGGGAGGSTLIKCETATLGTNLITATGGSPGSGGTGTGAVGRIHIDYSSSYSGTTNPTIDARQDLTIKSLSSLLLTNYSFFM